MRIVTIEDDRGSTIRKISRPPFGLNWRLAQMTLMDYRNPMSDNPHKQFDAVFIAQRKALLNRLTLIVDNAAVAEELTQESYLRVRQSLSQGANIQYLKGFLFQTGRHLALDYLRQIKRQNPAAGAYEPAEIDDPDQLPSAAPSPEQSLSEERRLQSLVALLDRLTPRQQQVFALNRVHGWSHARIAKQLGTSESTVQKEVKLVMAYCIELLSNEEK